MMEIKATISQGADGQIFYVIKVDGSVVFQQYSKAGSYTNRKTNRKFPNLSQVYEVFQNLEAVGNQYSFVKEIKPFKVDSEKTQQK